MTGPALMFKKIHHYMSTRFRQSGGGTVSGYRVKRENLLK
jgi:hypothetical protein